MEKQYIAHSTSSIRKYKSPGPAAYDIRETIGDVTAIKMKGRPKTKVDVTNAPYLNIPSSFGKVPAIKIGPVTERRNHESTPGPTYIPPPFGSDAKKISFSKIDGNTKSKSQLSARRKRNKDETPGPGPAAYYTRDVTFDPTKNKRGIKMKGHHEFSYNTGCSPGPATYKIKTTYDSTKPTAPKPAMHSRPKTREVESSAGYRNLGSTLSGPKFTMKARADDEIFLV